MTRPHRGYAAALPVLAARGLVPGPGGFAADDLIAYGQRRGWIVSVEPAPGRRRRWRASIVVHRAELGGYRGVINAASAHGPSEAAALVIALASMVVRAERER